MLAKFFSLPALFYMVSFTIWSPCDGQEKDFARMNDGQIMTLVEGCKSEKELEALINRIPISVIAKHALTALREPLRNPRFGKLVLRFLWLEFDPEVETRRLFTHKIWRDAKQRFETEAMIIDVKPKTVVLKKKNGQIREVEINRLDRDSAIRLNTYQRIRNSFLNRIPANVGRIISPAGDFEERFEKMGDAELWGMVEKCQNKKQLEAFLNPVPIPVLAKHAILDLEEPLSNHRFGKFVHESLWPDFNLLVEKKQLFELHGWQDVDLSFETKAKIFDVKPNSVVLRGTDDRLFEVAVDSLSLDSANRVAAYRKLRQKFYEKLPDKNLEFVNTKDFGQRYSRMSGQELWAAVLKCKDKNALRSLINQVPISVIASQAKFAANKSAIEAPFGKMVTRVIWKEFNSDVDSLLLSSTFTWQDDKKRSEVDASIFDVKDSTVVLKNRSGTLWEVPIEKLSDVSAKRLKSYQQVRQRFLERIPSDQDELFRLMAYGIAGDWKDRAAAIIAIKQIDEALQEGIQLLAMSGYGDYGVLLNMIVNRYGRGVDREKPAGAVLIFESDRPVVVFCLPVTHFEDFLGTLSGLGIDPETDGDFKRFSVGGQEAFALYKNDWVYFSDQKFNLARVPKRPEKLFEPLTGRFTISLWAKIQNFPASIRDQAAELLQEASKGPLEELGSEFFGQSGYYFRPFAGLAYLMGEGFKLGDLATPGPGNVIHSADEFTIGWAIDIKGKRTYIDLDLKARENTKLARRMLATATTKSRFKGFVRENAAVSIHGVFDLLDEDTAQLLSLISDYDKNIDETALEGKLVNQFLVVLKSVVESKKVDLAGSLLLADDTVDLVIAFHVPDGPGIDKVIDELMKTIETGYKDQFKIKPDVRIDAVNRLTFHQLEIAIPEKDDRARRVFGEKANFVIGSGPDAIYVGTGDDAIEAIKEAIVASGSKKKKELTGMELKLKLQPILELVARLEENNHLWRTTLNKMAHSLIDVAHSLKKTWVRSTKDGITATLETKGISQKFRFEIQDGVLGLIKIAFR